MRKLATIQKIKNLEKIENADLIEYATILGWKVVVKKNQFKIGDPCIYCEIDTILPDKPEFEFLRKSKFRIKTIRLKNKLSQGICFPLDILPIETQNHVEELYKSILQKIPNAESPIGMDVTDILGITKFEYPIPAELSGKVKGGLPWYVSMTDEERIQILPDVPLMYGGKKFIATEKLDGCLDGETILETEDGLMTIQDICISKYNGKIKSFDFKNNKIVFKKIKNHMINNPTKKWFEIELSNGKKIKLTGNHEIWLPKLGCWRRADQLNGDEEFLIN